MTHPDSFVLLAVASHSPFRRPRSLLRAPGEPSLGATPAVGGAEGLGAPESRAARVSDGQWILIGRSGPKEENAIWTAGVVESGAKYYRVYVCV